MPSGKAVRSNLTTGSLVHCLVAMAELQSSGTGRRRFPIWRWRHLYSRIVSLQPRWFKQRTGNRTGARSKRPFRGHPWKGIRKRSNRRPMAKRNDGV